MHVIPINRVLQFFPPRPPEPPPSPGDRILSGATSAGWSMILVDGRPAVGFELAGAVVMREGADAHDDRSYDELWALIHILARIADGNGGAQ